MLKEFLGGGVLAVGAATLVAACAAPAAGPAPTVSPPSDPSPLSVCAARPGTIRTENTLPGDSDWADQGDPTGPRADGYADTTSAFCDDTVQFYISSPKSYTIVAYRMGYYNGAGARAVWRSSTLPAQQQPAVFLDPVRKEVATNWTNPVSVPLDAATFPPGVYLFALRPDGGRVGYIPLTITTSTPAPLTFVTSTNTWQAYNDYGGSSSYTHDDEMRSVRINFRRPQQPTLFLRDDYPVIRQFEQRGDDVSYTTDTDSHTTGWTSVTKGVFFGAHSEYWTASMRRHLDDYLADGGSAVFFGANNVYWQPQTDTSAAYDHLDMFRDTTPDGIPFRNWGLWRRTDPEQRTLGGQYTCLGETHDGTTTGAWPFTDMPAGTVLDGFYTGETDQMTVQQAPPGTTVAATSGPFTCTAHQNEPVTADTSYRRTTSGGIVLDMGTYGFVHGLGADPTLQHVFDTIVTTINGGPLPLPSEQTYDATR